MRLLGEAAALYRPGFYPDVRPIEAMTARLQISAGDLEPATTWARERGLGVDDDPEYLHEYEHLTLARLLLARNLAAGVPSDPTEGASTLASVHGMLGGLQQAAADGGREGSVLEIQVLRALAHRAGGDRDAAIAVLGRALAGTPEPEGHVRLFADEGVAMLELLRDAAGDTGVGGAGTERADTTEPARRTVARPHAAGHVGCSNGCGHRWTDPCRTSPCPSR